MSHHFTFLASAQRTDLTPSDWPTILSSLAALAVFAVLAVIPIALAQRRVHPYRDAITILSILCCLVFAGSIIQTIIAHTRWIQEQLLQLQSGYNNPQAAEPGWPWWLWITLTVAYGVLSIFAGARWKK